MSITADDAMNAVHYLLATGTTTLKSTDTGAVWADYLTHAVDDPQPGELAPACRRALDAWAGQGRRWTVDVTRLADAINAERRDRREAVISRDGQPHPDSHVTLTEAQRREWMRVTMRALGMGAGRAEAEEAAYRAVGVTPPAPELPSTERPRWWRRGVKALLAALAERRALP